ncbi:MAG: class I SAM-dependent methyltransferase [Candidatus Udaeobacter sp.]
MNNTKPTGEITGKIKANPNPVVFGQRCVISWETNDPAGAEIRVSTGADDEKLVTRGGPSGNVEIPWITDFNVYEFRLYTAGSSEVVVDSVKARRDIQSAPAALREIANEAMRGNIDAMELSQFIAAVLPRCMRSERFREIFSLWERSGFHVTPVHFYQPIPNIQTLPETLWDRPSKLVGIDMNDGVQLDLLRNHFAKFRHEFEHWPTKPAESGRFYLRKSPFGGTDALVAYCMFRHFQPRLIIEVGGGFSSLVAAEAIAKNKDSALICIEPFPRDFLRAGFPGLRSLIEKKVEDMDVEFFSQLESGDILFIDSSHTVKIGGDVNFLFLEVLPRLKPGVIVHVHDIFLPFEYRRDWIVDEFRFWSEQYLLQAFLTFNSEFEVLMANRYLAHRHLEDLKAAFPSLAKLKATGPNSVGWGGGGSFWIRKKPIAALRQVQTPK